MNLRVRLLTAIPAAASVSAVAAAAGWAQRWNVVTITVLIALAWAATVSVADTLVGWNAERESPGAGTPPARAAVTYVVRLGEEGHEIARTSLALAAQAGPVVVVATRHHELMDDTGLAGIREYVCPTMDQALYDAARAITTDAVLVLAASAFPLRDACEEAAAMLTANVGWVTATAPAFNNDRYAPGERELLSARSRSAARRLGLVTWEPDATIIRTDLLQQRAVGSHRPDGAWLRDRAAAGWVGAAVREAVAVRAAPADAPMFWPAQTNRQRGAVADLADATTTGPLPARVAAVGALLRELYAWPIALWLLAIVLIGRSGTLPFSVSPVLFFTATGALAGARWLSSRLQYGVGLHPADEARAAAYDWPGSLVAVRSALTRRVQPIRFSIPDQPLLWAALVLTLVTTLPLLDRRASSAGAVGVAVGLALAALTVSWMFALRAFGTRGWDRATYRLPVDLPAAIDGQTARTIDASPGGLSLLTTRADFAKGSKATVRVSFADDTVSSFRARVTDVRHAAGRTAVGLALELDAGERVAWARNLFAAAGATNRAPILPIVTDVLHPLTFDRERTPLHRRFSITLQRVIVVAVSVVVGGALLLSLLGYRPMIERSGSMVPTLRVGDVVMAEWVRVDTIHPGEIISFTGNPDLPDLVTHRVRSVRVVGDAVRVTTKGDANTEPEQWSAPRGTLVGHVVWKIPLAGRALIVLGESRTRWLLVGATATILLVAALIRWPNGRRLARRLRRHRGSLAQVHDV